MSVIRIKKSHQKPYVTLDITALNDPRLSFRAKGLHTYLMSKPDDWHVFIDQLEKSSPNEGREAIRNALRELEDAGYVRREKLRGVRGRLMGWTTTVYETPALADEESVASEPPQERIGLTTDDAPTTGLPKSVPPKSVPPKSVPPKSAKPQLLSIDLNQVLTLPNLDKTSPPVSNETSPTGDDEAGLQGDARHGKAGRKTLLSRHGDRQAALKAAILGPTFLRWYDTKALDLDLDAQWDAFVSKALAKGYRYADWRQAFMNWLTSPYQDDTRVSSQRNTRHLSDTAFLAAMEEVERNGQG